MLWLCLHFIKLCLSLIPRFKHEATLKYLLVMKENQILRRELQQKGSILKFRISDKLFYVLMTQLSDKISMRFTIITPETVLYRWQKLVKKQWLYTGKKKPGRPPISQSIRKLIISIKNDNRLWGYSRISGELKKINIDVSRTTVGRIIRQGRKTGDIKPIGSWAKFLKMHWQTRSVPKPCETYFTSQPVPVYH